jgi:GTP-binding protein Era
VSELIPRAAALNRWESASTEVAQALSQHLVIAFLGSASCGKDSAIRALFGVDFGEISPIPGSTSEIQVSPLDARGQVMICNAPGFGDIRQRVDREARAVLQHMDLAVYVVNCEGGATIDERRDLDAIRALGRPVLVALNKIDLIRPHQRESFITTTLEQLGVEPKNAVVTAFDPLPALSPEPLGVDEVAAWIYQTLDQQGKALLFAKQLRNKALACEPVIRSAARAAMAAGAIPVPGADMTAVSVVQVKLITDIAAIHDREMGRDLVLFILGEVLAGTSKGFIRWAVRALKGAGWIPGAQLAHLATSALGASIAGATTYGVGKASIAYLQQGPDITPEQLRSVFDAAAHAYRETLAEQDAEFVDVEVVEE